MMGRVGTLDAHPLSPASLVKTVRLRLFLLTVLSVSLVGVINPALAQTIPGKRVSMIRTSEFRPASPDPSGIVYFRRGHRFLIADSEVDERTGAGHRGKNLWNIRADGSVISTRSTRRYSSEPTGLGSDSGRRLFVSDDDADRIWIVRKGHDHVFGTTDDHARGVRTYGSSDVEDPVFDRETGDLFFLDGVRRDVYRIDPVDRIFGNANDRMLHFDIGRLGPADFEAMTRHPSRDTLLVGGADERIYEITRRGRLVRVIDVSEIRGLRRISGLTIAPASNGSGRLNYWIVDRGIDNRSHRHENDGKLWEIALPS